MRSALAGLVMVVAVLTLAASLAAGQRGVVRTPGYAGTVRALPTQAPVAPTAATLGVGTRPDLLVDDAGTAHAVWSDARDGEPTRTVYCRLPRGARACEAVRELVPPGADRFSVDLSGPAVASVNDQVLVMSARYPQTVRRPDGGDGPNVVYLWTSDDGGQTFGDPAMVASGNGPGTAVAGDVRGGAVTFGPPEAPSIAIATGVVTGGVTVTTVRPGQYTPLGASVAVGDFLDARLAVHEGLPVVVYRDLAGNGFLRRWSGQGDPNDATTWTPPQPLPGFRPEVTVAGGRLLVALTDGLSGSQIRVVDPARPGAPIVLNRGGRIGNSLSISGLPDGAAVVSWQGTDRAGTSGYWTQTIGPDGRPQAVPSLIGAPNAFARAATALDGGGVAIAESAGGDRRVFMAAFGSRAPTGRLGLGSRSGGGALPADAAVACQRVRFAAVEALLQDGCFLNAATGRAKVSTGPLRLNGLVIVPDSGVQILIDPRARTIDTTGRVRVLLHAPGVPEILLFRGRLNLRLPTARAGAPLLSFGQEIFRPNILGFPVAGAVDVRLTDRGVTIPINLALPATLGGVRGSTVLRAENSRGLVVESLEFRADGVPLGAATMRRLRVQYKASGGTSVGDCLRPPGSGAPAGVNEWAGVFELQLPPPATGPSLCGSVRFAQGALRAATFNLDLPPPGIVLFPGVSMVALGGGLALAPTKLDATVRLGVIAAGAGASLVTLDGRLAATFGSPFTLRGDAATAVAGVPIGEGTFLMSTDGYVGLRLASGPSIGPLAVRTRIGGFIDAPRREFSLSGRGEVCIGDGCLPGGGAVVSTRGIAACLPAPAVPRGAGYRWGRPPIGGVEVWLLSCDMDDYEFSDARLMEIRSHQGGVGDAPLQVAGRPPSISVRVRGVGGVPDVEVFDPVGSPVVPNARFVDAESSTLYLGVLRPGPGRWSVRARTGSPAIAEAALSRQVVPASISTARVAGSGRAPRILSYRAAIGPRQAITLVERGRAGSRVIGRARAGIRTLRFTPGPGPAGRREIVALVEQGGLVRSQRTVARFTAPGPAPVGRASRLIVRRAGARAVATWRPATGLAAQRVIVRVSDGRVISRVVGPRARRVVAGGLVRGDRVTVRVVGQARDGRLGRASRATLRVR